MGKTSEPTADVAYYDDGGVRYRGFQLDGAMHGAWEFLRKDGSVMRSGEFDRGQQVGIWRTFDRGGRVVKETNYSKGTLVVAAGQLAAGEAQAGALGDAVGGEQDA